MLLHLRHCAKSKQKASPFIPTTPLIIFHWIFRSSCLLRPLVYSGPTGRGEAKIFLSYSRCSERSSAIKICNFSRFWGGDFSGVITTIINKTNNVFSLKIGSH